MKNIDFIIFLLILFFGGLLFLSSLSNNNYSYGLEDECIINPTSALCVLYCETLPLSEEFCNKAAENKARLEASAESVISKCLNNSSSWGCIPSMKHLIKTCETLNYLLDYCDREKLTASIFHQFYEIEKQYGETAALAIEAAAVEGANQSGLKSPKNITADGIGALLNKIEDASNVAKAENSSSNVTERTMDEVEKIFDEAGTVLGP